MLLLALGCAPHVPPTADPAGCAGCHDAETAAWAVSSHADAFTGPLFTRSWAETRAAWCLDCHGPEHGVGCATCHGPDARDCVDCHGFELPAEIDERGHVARGSGVLAQTTVAEWRASGWADAPCASCHPAHGDPVDARARLRAALGVTVRVEGELARATFTARRVGHALPTGDPFRRLELVLCADLACARPIASTSMSRRLERTDDGAWREASDTRIPPPTDRGDAVLERVLRAPGARTWRLIAHLADPRHTPELGDRARYVVATGRVEPR